jgi:hypothetical protein
MRTADPFLVPNYRGMWLRPSKPLVSWRPLISSLGHLAILRACNLGLAKADNVHFTARDNPQGGTCGFCSLLCLTRTEFYFKEMQAIAKECPGLYSVATLTTDGWMPESRLLTVAQGAADGR